MYKSHVFIQILFLDLVILFLPTVDLPLKEQQKQKTSSKTPFIIQLWIYSVIHLNIQERKVRRIMMTTKRFIKKKNAIACTYFLLGCGI